MSNKSIINLYDQYKNTKEKLKIICDWDEVIQPCEPYALWKVGKDKEQHVGFIEFFNHFWETLEGVVNYSPYSSSLYLSREIQQQQQEIKNSPDFYQQAPFLTIAEDLLKLIKEDKVEKLIFLSACDKRKFPNGDERKLDIFDQTFGSLGGIKDGEGTKDFVYYSCGEYTTALQFKLIPFDSEVQGQTKAEWIKENANDFDLVIDDNPNICKEVQEKLKYNKKTYSNIDYLVRSKLEVFAPYYPAIKHDERVLLIKNEVSNLKKEDFN